MAQPLDITALLQSSQSPDHAARSQAEQTLQEFSRSNAPAFMVSLSAELANIDKPADSRKLAGIILKNQLDSKDEAKKVRTSLPSLPRRHVPSPPPRVSHAVLCCPALPSPLLC